MVLFWVSLFFFWSLLVLSCSFFNLFNNFIDTFYQSFFLKFFLFLFIWLLYNTTIFAWCSVPKISLLHSERWKGILENTILSALVTFMSPPLHFRRKSPNIRRDRLEGWSGHSGVLLANLRNIWAFAPQFMGPDHSGKILNAGEEGPGPKKLVPLGKMPSRNWMPWRGEFLKKCDNKSLFTQIHIWLIFFL